jgi:ankyrin repeat protein
MNNKRTRRDANSKINKMVQALLAKNADVNIKDNTGTTSFSYGIYYNS